MSLGVRTQIERDAFEAWVASELKEGRDPSYKEREQRWFGVVCRANAEDRLMILEACRADPTVIPLVMSFCSMNRGAEGCIWWIDHFANTWEPRDRTVLPFVLFDFQARLLVKEIVDLLLRPDGGVSIDILVEKARDMGATWTLLAIFTWAWLFVPGFTSLIGAQDEKTVDDGGQNSTFDSLMGRMRFILKRLPEWMYRASKDLIDKTGLMQRPSANALVMGEPTNANFGRHGRFKVAMIDEAAWLAGTGEPLRAAHDACADTTRLLILLSTPNGMNYFGQLRHGQIGADDLNHTSSLKVITLRWHYHPLKNMAWCNREEARRTPEAFAQNVMINYRASVRGLVFHEYRDDLHVPDGRTRPPGSPPDSPPPQPVDFFPGFPLVTSYDPGRADAAAFGMYQADPFTGMHYCIFYIERTQRVVDWFVPFWLGFIPNADHAGNPWVHRYSPAEMQAIELVAGWIKQAGKPETNYGDMAGWQKTQNYALSAYEVLARYGIPMYGVMHDSKREAVDKAILLLRSTRFSLRAVRERWGDRGAKTLGECFTNYRWPEERESGMMHPHQSPMHGPFSHGADQFQIYASQQQIGLQNVPIDPETLQPLNASFLPKRPRHQQAQGFRGVRGYNRPGSRAY